MTEAVRREYLEALGIEVWQSRPPPVAQDRLVIGPGRGSTLLVCASPTESAGKLAGDVVRALAAEPVWAWPDPAGDTASETLEEAIANRLFTRVIVFGEGPGALLYGGDVPAVLGSASINQVPGLEDLAISGSNKRAFWDLAKSWRETPARPETE